MTFYLLTSGVDRFTRWQRFVAIRVGYAAGATRAPAENDEELYAATLRRTAAVVRNRRDVTDRANLDAGRSESADGGLTTRAGTRDAHIDRAETVLAGSVGGANGSLLRGERGSLTGAAEAERARALPAERVARLVGDGDDGVVERSLDEYEAKWNVLPLALFELLALTGLGAGSLLLSLSHGLLRRFLLTGDGALARALAGTSVSVGALAADRKRTAVAEATVGLDFDEALDVERHVLAEVAFDLAFLLDDVTDAVQLILVERCDLGKR